MSKLRIPSSGSKSSRSLAPGPHFQRFIGISLSGVNADKTCIVCLDFYPDHKKLVVSSLFEKIKNENQISSDAAIIELIKQQSVNLKKIGIDVPLSLPKCIECRLKCPGAEVCKVPEINWIRNKHFSVIKGKKPKKTFSPYTQRAIDFYLSNEIEESFEIHHALGANLAPLTARAHFLRKRIQYPLLEVEPSVAVWRLGLSYKIPKSYLRFYSHSVSGLESRKFFLKEMALVDPVFIYQQDQKSIVENLHLFRAFVVAFTSYLEFYGRFEKRPKGFPRAAAWSIIPRI